MRPSSSKPQTVALSALMKLLRRAEVSGDRDDLDRLLQVLVEEARRGELERAEEPLPAQVVAGDVGGDQVGVALQGGDPRQGGELGGGELAEIGARDGLAEGGADVHVVARAVDEHRRRERVEIVQARVGRLEPAGEAVGLDVGVLEAHAADEAQAVAYQGQLQHAVHPGDLLRSREVVALLRQLLEDEGRRVEVAVVLGNQQLSVRSREVEGAGILVDGAEAPEGEVAVARGVGEAGLELGAQAGPEVGERQPGLEGSADVDGVVLQELVQVPVGAQRRRLLESPGSACSRLASSSERAYFESG